MLRKPCVPSAWMGRPGESWPSGGTTWAAGSPAALLAPLAGIAPGLATGANQSPTVALAGAAQHGEFRTQSLPQRGGRRIVPGLALHADLGPDDFAGAGMGLVLALMAAGSGFRVPFGERGPSRRHCFAVWKRRAARSNSIRRVERDNHTRGTCGGRAHRARRGDCRAPRRDRRCRRHRRCF